MALRGAEPSANVKAYGSSVSPLSHGRLKSREAMEGPAGLQRWAGAAALPPPLSPEDGTRDPGAGPSVGAGTMGGRPVGAPQRPEGARDRRSYAGGKQAVAAAPHPAAGPHAADTAMI